MCSLYASVFLTVLCVYCSYKRSTYYWASCMLLRRLLLSIVSNIFPPSYCSAERNLCTMLVLICGLYFHTLMRPFAHNSINRVETASLLIAIITVLLASFIYETAGECNTSEISHKAAHKADIATICALTLNLLLGTYLLKTLPFKQTLQHALLSIRRLYSFVCSCTCSQTHPPVEWCVRSKAACREEHCS